MYIPTHQHVCITTHPYTNTPTNTPSHQHTSRPHTHTHKHILTPHTPTKTHPHTNTPTTLTHRHTHTPTYPHTNTKEVERTSEVGRVNSVDPKSDYVPSWLRLVGGSQPFSVPTFKAEPLGLVWSLSHPPLPLSPSPRLWDLSRSHCLAMYHKPSQTAV